MPDLPHLDDPKERDDTIDSAAGEEHRDRIEASLGQDADWEDPATAFNPAKSIGQSPAATALQVEIEDPIAELQRRRPEQTAKSDRDRYLEAVHYTTLARQLLAYHASGSREPRATGWRGSVCAMRQWRITWHT